MAISVGDKLPDGVLRVMGADGPEEHTIGSLFDGQTVALFGLPGAFTGTCSSAHLPSFMKSEADLRAKGVDRVICVSVNDVFVMDAWSKDTGADKTGIDMLADGDASFTKALGMEFSAPPVGLIDRSKRYSMVVKDRVVTALNEDEPGVCNLTAGDALVSQI